MDLPYLRRDISKYSVSYMSTEAIQWWISFIDVLESSMETTPSVATSWPYQELLEVIQDNQTVLQQIQHNEPQNDQLHRLRAAEIDPIPEVISKLA